MYIEVYMTAGVIDGQLPGLLMVNCRVIDGQLSSQRQGNHFLVAFSLIFIVTHGFAVDTLSFPKDFLLGTASSAYQVKGDWNENGT